MKFRRLSNLKNDLVFLMITISLIGSIFMINEFAYNGQKSNFQIESETDKTQLKTSDSYITITAPTSSSLVKKGDYYWIEWTCSGSVYIFDVKIELYKGGSFYTTIVSSSSLFETYTWNVPASLPDATDYQIKVIKVDEPSVYDYSDNFEIYSNSLTVISPTSSSLWETGTLRSITWTSTGDILIVNIDLYKGGSFVDMIAFSTTNDGIYSWTVPSYLSDGTDYRIKIAETSHSSTYDYSDYFEIYTYIEPKSLTITSPTSSSSWETGTLHSITWTSTGDISFVGIDLYKGGSFVDMIAFSTTNDGTYSWTVPSFLSDGMDYRILISDFNGLSAPDYSDYFEIYTYIEPKSLTITSQTSSSSWETGTLHSISWTSTGDISFVDIDLYKGGSFVDTIAFSTTNDGTYSWTVPSYLSDGTDYRIKIAETPDSSTYDYSDYFELYSPSPSTVRDDAPSVPGFEVGFLIITLLGVAFGYSIIILAKRKLEKI